MSEGKGKEKICRCSKDRRKDDRGVGVWCVCGDRCLEPGVDCLMEGIGVWMQANRNGLCCNIW